MALYLFKRIYKYELCVAIIYKAQHCVATTKHF